MEGINRNKMILPVAIFDINLGDWLRKSQGDRTQSRFFEKTIAVSSAPSNPSLSNIKKYEVSYWIPHIFGGKRGIRTLGAFIGHTRFPVVRLRPAQPSFHRFPLLRTLDSQVLLYYISRCRKCQVFFFKNIFAMNRFFFLYIGYKQKLCAFGKE